MLARLSQTKMAHNRLDRQFIIRDSSFFYLLMILESKFKCVFKKTFNSKYFCPKNPKKFIDIFAPFKSEHSKEEQECPRWTDRELILICVTWQCYTTAHSGFQGVQKYKIYLSWFVLQIVVFRDEDNFCKAFAGAKSYHEWQSGNCVAESDHTHRQQKLVAIQSKVIGASVQCQNSE